MAGAGCVRTKTDLYGEVMHNHRAQVQIHRALKPSI